MGLFKSFNKRTPPPNGGDLPEIPQNEQLSNIEVAVDEKRMAEWNVALRSYKNARSVIENKTL